MTSVHSRWFRSAFAAAVLTFCGAAEATTLIRAGLDELSATNQTIVVGEVLEAESYWNHDGSFILTDVTLQPVETIKGEASGPITVTLMGGTVGETTSLIVAGASLVPGRSYVVFLDEADLPGASRTLTVRDHSQGVFDIVEGKDGELRAVSQAVGHPLLPDGQGLVDAPGGVDGFPVDALVASLHQLVAKEVK